MMIEHKSPQRRVKTLSMDEIRIREMEPKPLHPDPKIARLLERHGSVRNIHEKVKPEELRELGYEITIQYQEEGSEHGKTYVLRHIKNTEI